MLLVLVLVLLLLLSLLLLLLLLLEQPGLEGKLAEVQNSAAGLCRAPSDEEWLYGSGVGRVGVGLKTCNNAAM